MTGEQFESKIISYREDANDYRLCLTLEDIQEVKQALNQKSLIDEIRELIKAENASTNS